MEDSTDEQNGEVPAHSPLNIFFKMTFGRESERIILFSLCFDVTFNRELQE